MLTVEDMMAIAQQLSNEENKIHILQVLREMISDKSWRVRYMVAEHFVKVSKSTLSDSLCFS
jgi:serine/threonine-protein phosphatase 2A regulatory subunit A